MNPVTNKVDIFIEQGTDWTYDFPVDPSIDLTLATAAMMIRTVDGSTFIQTLTTANGSLVVNANANLITATISNIATSQFVPLSYVYDIKVQIPNFIYRTNEGSVIVDQQITNIAPPVVASDTIGDASGNSIGDANGNEVGN